MTRAEMYETVRKSLSDCYVDALDALAALEAGERDKGLESLCGCGHPKKAHMRTSGADCGCSVMLPFEPDNKKCCPCEAFATPPAPPATEAIVTSFARDFFVRHDHTYSGIEIYEWLKKQKAGPVAPPAAECAIGIVQEVAEQFDGNDEQFHAGYVRACEVIEARIRNFNAALAAPCECQRLREELEERRAQLSALAEVRDLQIGKLAAELRQSVDALRPFANVWDKRPPFDVTSPFRVDCEVGEYGAWHNTSTIVAAYDAKHGEKS